MASFNPAVYSAGLAPWVNRNGPLIFSMWMRAFLRSLRRIGNLDQLARGLLRIRIRSLAQKLHLSMPHTTANPAMSTMATIVRRPIRFKPRYRISCILDGPLPVWQVDAIDQDGLEASHLRGRRRSVRPIVESRVWFSAPRHRVSKRSHGGNANYQSGSLRHSYPYLRPQLAFSEFDMRVRVHEPQPENLSYATIRQLKTDNDQLLELLALEAWNDVRIAKPFVEAVGPWRKRS
jgi:hypothetical protein